jgi:hypothetical protein
MSNWIEEDLVATLSGVLLKDDIEGLDEDLVAYISGLLSTQLQDSNSESCEDILEESMIPFLDSVACPAHLVEEAKTAILSKVKVTVADPAPSSETRKLKQGIVNMSSTLTKLSDEESNRYLWDTDEKIKANANIQKDAYQDKTSAKDLRKQRQELEKARRELARHQQQLQQLDQVSTKAGVSAMVLPTVMSKEKDVLLQNITLALDNGTSLLEHGDLKFAYQRRYVNDCIFSRLPGFGTDRPTNILISMISFLVGMV